MIFIQLNYIPFHFIKPINFINFLILKIKLGLGRKDKIFYWFTYINGFTIKLINENSFTIIDLATRRQVMDSLSEKAKEIERKAVKKANVVFVDNYNTYLDYKDLNTNIHYLPQGVSSELFNKPASTFNSESFNAKNRKIIGYCGALHASINYEILSKVIKALPEYYFVFVGNIIDKRANELNQFENVKFVGRKSKEELVDYYHLFDVGLIPYELTPFTSGVFPTKLFEYAACGVPIISSALPDLLQYEKPYLKIYHSAEEMIEQIKELSQNKLIFKSDLTSLAKDNTWEKRFDYILNSINHLQ